MSPAAVPSAFPTAVQNGHGEDHLPVPGNKFMFGLIFWPILFGGQSPPFPLPRIHSVLITISYSTVDCPPLEALDLESQVGSDRESSFHPQAND